MKEMRFKTKSKIFDVSITFFAAAISVGIVLYGVLHFDFGDTWSVLVINLIYIAALVMMWMFIYNIKITPTQFNCWCSVCVGASVLLRDILFQAPLSYFGIRIATRFLSVVLILLLNYFYARKDWESYSKRKLMMICFVDMMIAALYTVDICIEPKDAQTTYLLTEIWIRPTITYGLVACFVSEKE